MSTFLIPARAGSKGVLKKNLRLAGGISLLRRTVLSAIETELGEVFVSSDNEEILNEAMDCGASVHLRESWAASDDATANDVVKEFSARHEVETLIYLQPTSPLRTAEHISEAWQLFVKAGKPVVSVSVSKVHPAKMLRLNDQGFLTAPRYEQGLNHNRQSLDPVFVHNGAIYIFAINDFLKTLEFPIEGAVGYIMNGASSVDIDDEFDLQFADYILEARKDG